MYCRLLHFVISLLVAANVAAQDVNVSRRVSSADGLSNDFVLCLSIDGDGYIWAGTEAGLNRITGRKVESRLTGRRISSLYYHAATRTMLVGSESGLVITPLLSFPLEKGNTGASMPENNLQWKENGADELIAYSVDDIAEAGDGGVWVIYGHGKVQHLDCETGKVEDLAIKDSFGNRCGMDDGQGHLYLGHSHDGMSIISLKDGSSVRYTHRQGDDTSLPGDNVRCIVKDSEGCIWVGTDRGLALFNPDSGTFVKVTRSADDYDDNVYDIKEMTDGTLWVATDMGGVRVLGRRRIASTGVLRYDTLSVQTSSINVRCIAQDEFSNVWLGNHSTGVDFVSAKRSLFKVMENVGLQVPIYALATDPGGGIWVSSEDNLLYLLKDGTPAGQWAITSQTHREHAFARSLMVDSKGNVWLGMEDGGVVKLVISQPSHKGVATFERIDIGHEGSDIHSFGEDKEGRIWIGSEFGVYTYYNGEVRREEEISRITNNAPVTSFLWTNDDEMTVATLGTGVHTIDLHTMNHVSLKAPDGLPSDKVNQAVLDRNGGLWLATAGGLVYVADPIKLRNITVYDSSHGLADNHVSALQIDGMGRVWVSTLSGVACLNWATGRFYNYNYFDDQYLNGFFSGAAVTTTQGDIIFGAASGACLFNPMDFNDVQHASQVQIVSCEVYSPVGDDTQILTLVPDRDGRVYTTYKQSTLRMMFTLRDYAQTGWEEYSYIMKGRDREWYYIGNDQDVVFRGLSPGNYAFVLRAKLKSQDWEEATVTQLEISIAPPFWKSWWAYTLYALAILLWALYLLRSYKRRLMLRNSLEMEKRESQQKQELNEERLRFFTNVTHELRTPLTLILGPLEDLMSDESLPAASRRRVGIIQKSALQLRSLINDILEFRKTQTQNRRLTVARGDLGQFLREICLNYKELYRNPKVQFSFNIPAELPMLYFDSEVITTIVNNLLSNAIKYTEKGSISVDAKEEGGMLSITVADTGYGIAAEALPHVFERYYQVKGSHQASGTGIGLALVKSLADLHEARLSAASEEYKGSSFTLSLSVDNTYPHALHKEDEPQQDAATAEMTDEVTAETTDQQSLLIVEDNADIRQYIADSFSEDFRILQATNGEEGLKMALEHIPDIIVSDIMMPHMNGIEMTKKVKANISTSHIPVILLTAKVTDEDKEEGYDSGADSYLTKPFAAKLLASRIQNLLSTRRHLAELILSRSTTTTATSPQPSTATLPSLSRLDQEFMDNLDRVITDNIMTEDLDMAFMTDKMAMSHSTFYRKVKALTGMTAKEYIRKYRLRHCYQLLESGGYNVTEAAMMTGFNQMAHFRDIFKKEFGIAPSEVLKRKRQS